VPKKTPTVIDNDIHLQNDVGNVENLTLKVPKTAAVYDYATGDYNNDINTQIDKNIEVVKLL